MSVGLVFAVFSILPMVHRLGGPLLKNSLGAQTSPSKTPSSRRLISVEAVAQELAPFGIEFTLVELGPTKTNFGGGWLLHRRGPLTSTLRPAKCAGYWIPIVGQRNRNEHFVSVAQPHVVVLQKLMMREILPSDFFLRHIRSFLAEAHSHFESLG